MAIKLSSYFATILMEAAVQALDGCTVGIFGGTEPVDGDAADSPTLLAEIVAPSPTFVTDQAGGAVANAIPASTWLANGTATHFRAYYPGSPSITLKQGSVGVTGSGADAIINSVTAVSGAPVQILSWLPQMPLA